MPLLRHKNQPEPVVEQPSQTHDDNTKRKGSLFSRRPRSTSPTGMQMDSRQTNSSTNNYADDQNVRSSTRGRGFFSRRRSHSSSDGTMSRTSARTGTGSDLGFNSSIHDRPMNDPSIIIARQKVGEAEEAERQADRALAEARATVRDVRQHVKNLEREIEEEARMHRLKQQEAKQVSKSAKGLGRHG